MIQASTRFVPHIVILLVLAALPTWLHRTSSLEVDDCADPDALFSIDGGRSVSAEEVLASGEAGPRELFLSRASADGHWTEGQLYLEGGDELDFVLVRSFDAKLLYHWPAARMHWEGNRSQRVDRNELEIVAGLPVHRSYYDTIDASSRRRWVVAYLLVYEARPVANPYLAQLLWGPLELVRGRSPMSLFFVSGRVDASRRQSAEDAAHRWLVAAWDHYSTVCRDGTR